MTEGRLAPEEVRTRTFTRVVRGYRRREVRRLLERAAADLARLRHGRGADGPDDQPPLTPEQVEEARFQPALGGYEMDEVDTVLDEVAAELQRAAQEPFRPASAPPARPASAPSPPKRSRRRGSSPPSAATRWTRWTSSSTRSWPSSNGPPASPSARLRRSPPRPAIRHRPPPRAPPRAPRNPTPQVLGPP
ncbi:MAG TPA: DivIVA domain-containing protein, partial [Actinomycetota bacterium]|nr:DivIVA domain-containing protein [Actinomycetota bacterium]